MDWPDYLEYSIKLQACRKIISVQCLRKKTNINSIFISFYASMIRSIDVIIMHE